MYQLIATYPGGNQITFHIKGTQSVSSWAHALILDHMNVSLTKKEV